MRKTAKEDGKEGGGDAGIDLLVDDPTSGAAGGGIAGPVDAVGKRQKTGFHGR